MGCRKLKGRTSRDISCRPGCCRALARAIVGGCSQNTVEHCCLWCGVVHCLCPSVRHSTSGAINGRPSIHNDNIYNHTIPRIRSPPAPRLRVYLTLTPGNANLLQLARLNILHTANRLHDSLPWSSTSQRTRSHASAQLSINCFAVWSLLALMGCCILLSHA